MYLKKLVLSGFRNYKELIIEFPPEGAVFEGENGSGKTNLLESMYMLYTCRSQRNAQKSEMVNFDSACATVAGDIVSENGETGKECRIVFNHNAVVEMKIDDKKITSLAEWFGTQTIMSFSPDDIEIIHGLPAHRRRFLDFLISLFDKEYLRALIEYRKNLSLRNVLLKTRMDEILCEIYEERMAETGAIICHKRVETISQLNRKFVSLHRDISDNKDTGFFNYEPSFMSDLSSKKTWKEVFYTMLCGRRKKDQETGFSSHGPHRDEIRFFINNKPAGNVASQGQKRSIVLSLKISAAMYLEERTGRMPVILFDDAVSELDHERTRHVYSIVENLGQLFIACPRKTMPLKENIRRYAVSGGAVVAL